MSTYEISKSSLLSLKAEILRKQEELAKVKQDNAVKLGNIKKNSHLFIKNKGIDERKEKDETQEENNLLKRSREALEIKAKLYDKLASNRGAHSEDSPGENKTYLVEFERKASFNSETPEAESEQLENVTLGEHEDTFYEDDTPENPDDEWVEYVDCLGRTRTCLRKDLEYLKSDDEQLKKQVQLKRNDEIQDSNNESINDTETAEDNRCVPEKNCELSSSDMRRELLRQRWENEEEELRKKTNIHYEDLLYDEARSHGVGYYGFSKDEEERAKQQAALNKLRQETVEQQKRNQELRTLREKQLAARLKAARNRKRARMGLPPEEEEPEPEQPKSPEKEVEESPKPLVDEKDLAREEARNKHVRPWDIGKEGVKEHYVYTQEEWVDKKREERLSEFAPPSSSRKDFRSVVPQNNITDEFQDKSLRFTSKRIHKSKTTVSNSNNEKNFNMGKSLNPYKNNHQYEYTEQPELTEPVPIVNECQDVINEYYPCLSEANNDGDSNCSQADCIRGKGVEIAPPVTFDYYGPSDSKKKKVEASRSSLEDSINAGLKFLRNQFEVKNKSTKHPDEMFLM